MMTVTWKRFSAEILFLNPEDVPRAIAALADAGCEFEQDLDAIDPDYPTVFGIVYGTTELDVNGLGNWLIGILDPLGGHLDGFGYDEAPSPMTDDRTQGKVLS